MLPFHRRRAPRAAPERTYSQGWIDGAAYVERWRAWSYRLQGAVAGVLFACAIEAAFLYFGGRP